MDEEPSVKRIQTWSDRKTTPFDPFDAMSELTHRTTTCPSCRNLVDCRESLYGVPHNIIFYSFVHSFILAFYDESGKGYCQKFSMTCPYCKFEITKETLAVLKFAQDVVKSSDTDEASAYLAYVDFLQVYFVLKTEIHS
jgi:hypothetical protein